MTETDGKPGRAEQKKPVKQGLHGWKAALAMFGCGSLAAFGVFGVLTLLLTSIFNFSSSGLQTGSSGEGDPPEAIGEPQASIDPGDLDVCSRNIESATSLNVTRTDSGDNFDDPGEGEKRVVRDQCEWELVPDASAVSSWKFYYEYSAFISDPGSSRDEAASRKFSAEIDSIQDGFDDISSHGEESLADSSYYVFGEISPGVTGYHLVAQTNSAVYVIKLNEEEAGEEGDSASQGSMRHEAEKIVEISDIEFNIWIPDE